MHTNEPWHVGESDFTGTDILCADEEQIASVEIEANARRIVACVNACAGIPTEALEDGSARAERDQLREMTGGTFYEIKKQRDELMKALEHQCEVLNRNGYSTNKAQEAIARVKGES